MFLALVLFVIWNLGFGVLSAASVEELRDLISGREREIQEVEKEIQEYQAQIDLKVTEAKTLKNEIKRLDTLIAKVSAELRLTNKKINTSTLMIKKLLLEISEKKVEITAKKLFLAETFRAINEEGSESLVEILLKNTKFSEFFGSIRHLENLEISLNEEVVLLKTLKAELELKEEEEIETREGLENLASELKDRKALEELAKNSKNQLLVTTKNREAEYQKILREREKKRAEILEEIRRVEDELRLLIDPLSLPQPRPGVLAWPVAVPLVTQGFGKTAFARSNSDVYGELGHNGIDLRAPIGSQVLAAEGGMVKGVGNTDNICPGGSYGQWILIEHPNRLATLYAHLSLIRVSSGQEIKRGQLVGYSGDTGYTTGPHVHFTVYDSRTVEIKRSRVCGLLPYGGYLDPLIYL
jgi:murein DD-endopeptidase MepM/ murein hydrolase activator NlpD